VLPVDENDKSHILLDLITSVKGLTIIFVETKKKADMLEDFLCRQGFGATSIHGDRDQQDRNAALRTFSSGQTPYLIATNVAARGLDIENIMHVINYDMPTDIDDYVHRIGRTGRAGKPGLATALITEENASIIPKLLEILSNAQQEIPKWLEGMKSHRGGNSGHGNYGSNRGYSRGGGNAGRFGGRDFRSPNTSREERGDARGDGNRRGGGNNNWGANDHHSTGGNSSSSSSSSNDRGGERNSWW